MDFNKLVKVTHTTKAIVDGEELTVTFRGRWGEISRQNQQVLRRIKIQFIRPSATGQRYRHTEYFQGG